MFCRFCGNKISDGLGFCSKCGKLVNAEPEREEREVELEPDISVVTELTDTPSPDGTPREEKTADSSEEVLLSPEEEENRSSLARRILTFGILGLAFSAVWFFSVIGLAFSIVSKVLVSRYVARYGETSGKATVGKALGKAGFVVGIVLTALVASMLLGMLSALII